MSYADLQIVAIALILAMTYGIFLYMYAAQPTADIPTPTMTNNTSPGSNASVDSGDFFSNVGAVVKLNTESPEIFFINSTLFSTIFFLLAFVGLRWLRATG